MQHVRFVVFGYMVRTEEALPPDKVEDLKRELARQGTSVYLQDAESPQQLTEDEMRAQGARNPEGRVVDSIGE